MNGRKIEFKKSRYGCYGMTGCMLGGGTCISPLHLLLLTQAQHWTHASLHSRQVQIPFITMAPHQTATCHPAEELLGGVVGGFFPMFPEELQRLAPLQLGTCVIHCLISGGNKVPICLSSWETGLQRRRIFVENHKLCFTKKKKSLHPCGGFSSACTSQISHAWIHALQKLLFFY